MRIVFATSEVTPFSKTGGLADVSSGLPKALALMGHHVTVITPHYPQLMPTRLRGSENFEKWGKPFYVELGDQHVGGKFLKTSFPSTNGEESSVEVLLVDQPDYFDRRHPYGQDNIAYEDNCARFTFFCRAVAEAIRQSNIVPDILHVNDWQTGLLPAMIAEELRPSDERYEKLATVLTIHNLSFQGQFWHWDMPLTGFDWKYFNWRQMECNGELNLLKTGIVFADMITTVSPTYAREIQSPDFGEGLDSVLQTRHNSLQGILNGVDVTNWNPETDPYIKANYCKKTVIEGKAQCKAFLQDRMKLPVSPETPLLAIISRLTDQKGIDLIIKSISRLRELGVQLAVLGSGEPSLESLMEEAAKAFPDQLAVEIGFSEELAHQIEAGADMFLMPSRFEPCGLNQMYSMMYGTVPVVYPVGGLKDSVIHASEEAIQEGLATGFDMMEYSPDGLAKAVEYAVDIYKKPEQWKKIQLAGMSHDWTWQSSAKEYEKVYHNAHLAIHH